jgi:hypothetical protein
VRQNDGNNESSHQEGRHGQDYSKSKSEGDQDEKGWEARVGDEAQDLSSPPQDRRSSGKADQETHGSEAHNSPQVDGGNPARRTGRDLGARAAAALALVRLRNL